MAQRDFEEIATRYGGDFLECHAYNRPLTWDVIGDHPLLKPNMEAVRYAGVCFRYFKTHQERLDEFQKRLDAAKKLHGIPANKKAALPGGEALQYPADLVWEACGKANGISIR